MFEQMNMNISTEQNVRKLCALMIIYELEEK